MKKKKYTLDMDTVVKHIVDYLHDCDADELARLCGEIFGGECYPNSDGTKYDFEPNEYYSGEFNDLK